MRTLPEKYLSEIPISKEEYEIDLAILDRYQSFSGELLRMALLGLAGYGFLIANVVLRAGSGASLFFATVPSSRYALALGAVSLCICVMCSLGHRYYSTDSIAHHVRRLRLRKRMDQLCATSANWKELDARAAQEIDSLHRDLTKCRWLLVTAAALLVVGAFCVAWSFAATLFPHEAAA